MEVMVSKGFVIYAQNSDIDYVRQAYALALTIKISQTAERSVALVTNDIVPDKYKSAFDYIIPVPWFDSSESILKSENRWQLYHATPYDETIVLDSDMLMLNDISDWWAYLSHRDVAFCSKIKNYKLETIEKDVHHRKSFLANNLPNPYFALHYFKKTDIALEFYKSLEFVINNWELCYGKFAPKEYQNWVSMDLSSAIAIELAGMQGIAIDVCSPLEFVHMKSPLQGWEFAPTNWQDAVPVHFNSNKALYVGNIKQPSLFHYVESNFLTDLLLTKIKEFANES